MSRRSERKGVTADSNTQTSEILTAEEKQTFDEKSKYEKKTTFTTHFFSCVYTT